MNVTVRPARKDELPRLHAIWQAAVEATHGFVAPDHRVMFGEMVRNTYLPTANLLVAVDGHDRPTGWLGRAPGELEALFVDPAHHGQGIGRALVEAAFDPAEPLRVDVNEANEGAAAFYRRLGFREVGRSTVDGMELPYPLIHLSRGRG